MGQWDKWVGRKQEASDHLDESLSHRWLATFDLPKPDKGIMPQGIHFALCTPDAPTSALGEDGHPARNDSPDSFLPPFPMPRRMWGASMVEFHAPIAIGAAITRTSRIDSIEEKDGSTGKLALVSIEHETKADGKLALRETQVLTYLNAMPRDAPLYPGKGPRVYDPGDWTVNHTVIPDTRLLFRYSALTFNAHRIHYDEPYTRDIERYRGLVVQGPLIATLLMRLAAREFGENKLRKFGFRGLSPAIVGEELHLTMRKYSDRYDMAAFGADGRQITRSTAYI